MKSLRLDLVLVATGILVAVAAVIQPQLSLPRGGVAPASPDSAIGAVTTAAPSPLNQQPSPIDAGSSSPPISPASVAPSPSLADGTPAPPAPGTPTAPPAPRTRPTPAPTPAPTRRPTPPQTPAPTPSPTQTATIHLAGGLVDLSSGASAHTLSATVKDGSNHPVAGQTVAFIHAGGTGTVAGLGKVETDAAGVATAHLVGVRAGPITLRIEAGSVSATVSFTVVAGSLDRLVLSPGLAQIASGGSQTFRTMAYDAAGNVIGDVSASAVLSISRGGTCTGSSCTATKSGPHIVTAVYSGKSDWAILMVHGKDGDAE
jgi:hypothetical protein